MSQINVFTMLFDMWRAPKEQIVCKFIGELLNPEGAHDKGDLYLKKFVAKVLNRGRLLSDGSIVSALNVNTFEGAAVNCEVSFPVRNPKTNRIKKLNVRLNPKTGKIKKYAKQKRMDMAIDLSNYYVVIETKINAGDSETQCQDYYVGAAFEAKRKGKMPLLYYLTKDGTSPDPISIGNLSRSNIRLISFDNEILPWLEDCLNQPQTRNDSDLYNLMKNFYEALKKIL